MATLYVDRRDAELDLAGETLVLRGGADAKSSMPLRPIERLVVGASAKLSSRLLARLAERGIGLLVLAGREKRPVTTLMSLRSNDPRLRLAQYDAALDALARAAVGRRLIEGKILGQAEFLKRLSSRRRLRFLAETVTQLTELSRKVLEAEDAASIMGLEGAAAAAYFRALPAAFHPSLRFTSRMRRPPPDPVNACLSLGYSLATLEAARVAASAGMDIDLGLVHALSPGRQSLALDLVEPARPRVDAWVHELFARRRLRLESFSTDPAGGCLITKTARRTIYRAYEKAADEIHEPIRRSTEEIRSALLDRFEKRPASKALPAAEPHE